MQRHLCNRSMQLTMIETLRWRNSYIVYEWKTRKSQERRKKVASKKKGEGKSMSLSFETTFQPKSWPLCLAALMFTGIHNQIWFRTKKKTRIGFPIFFFFFVFFFFFDNIRNLKSLVISCNSCHAFASKREDKQFGNHGALKQCVWRRWRHVSFPCQIVSH